MASPSLRNNKTKKPVSSKNPNTRKSIIRIVIMAVTMVVIIIALIVGVVYTSSRTPTSTSSNGEPSSSSSTAMPSNASASAAKWFISVLKDYDGSMKNGYLQSDSATKDLASMANGDYSTVPQKIQNAFYWSSDAQKDSKTIDFNTLKAAGYTAIMSAWQLRYTALENNKSFSYDDNLIYVDKTHNTVTIPAEAWCGLPAELTIQLVWNGSEWRINGADTAIPVTAKVRASQLQSIISSKSSSDTSSSK